MYLNKFLSSRLYSALTFGILFLFQSAAKSSLREMPNVRGDLSLCKGWLPISGLSWNCKLMFSSGWLYCRDVILRVEQEKTVLFLYPSHQKVCHYYSNHPVKFELSKEIHPTGQVGDAKSFSLWQCGLIETPELSAKHNIPIPLPFLTKSGMGQECWQICTHLTSNVMQD